MRGLETVSWFGSLDHLARSLKQPIGTAERLCEREIGFRSLTERIDITTAGGKLTLYLFEALAEFERERCCYCAVAGRLPNDDMKVHPTRR